MARRHLSRFRTVLNANRAPWRRELRLARAGGELVLYLLLSVFLAVQPTAASDPHKRLPTLCIDPEAVSVSGISSGAYFAHQFHVAHSRRVMGAGIFAGGPYFCAGQNFPQNLFRSLNVCSNTGSGPFRGPPAAQRSISAARIAAATGGIDDTSGLRGDRVFLFSGRLDTLVPKSLMEALIAFDQTEFTKASERHGLALTGYAYVPQACAHVGGCRLHVAFHGCLQNTDTIGDAFIRHAGYNEWAEANRIVVLYPQAAAVTSRVAGIEVAEPAGLLGLVGLHRQRLRAQERDADQRHQCHDRPPRPPDGRW